jgi:hexosaminidase
MNVFHWHLTDDGGWRLEIKKYPKLTEVGAWRAEQNVEWSYQGLKFPGKSAGVRTYGGFYSQKEVRDIVKYAADRFITVVPEIEMPGHSTETVAAYPDQLMCDAPADFLKSYVAGWGADYPMMVCAGKESATQFFKDVLTEVLDLFPSKVIHIGGDEVPKELWAECAACKDRMAKEGLRDTGELQSSFVKRMDSWLEEHGRRLIGWDEILEGGLAPGAMVMSWRGISGGIAAAKSGHDVVMSPTSHCYFDYPYSSISTQLVYSYEPIPGDLTPSEGQRVLGAQANIWTEWLSSEEEVESMMFPRAAALAEVLWTKFERRDWDSFRNRLSSHYARLDRLGIAYFLEPPSSRSDLVLLGTSQPIEFDPVTVPDAIIRYTIDGSDPTPTSAVYKGAIRLNRAGPVRAAIFRPNGTHSAVTTIAAVSIRPDESAKIAGINRRVLDGVFAKCPDPSAFQAVVAKNVASVGLGEYAGRDNYALQFDGFLRIPADGEYTFYLGSDDGSKMWLGDQLVADNDGLHAFGEKRLKLNLPRGDYPFRIVMFEQGGSESLRFSVEAMGQTKQLVPDAWYWSKG